MILVINTGSSSIKMALIRLSSEQPSSVQLSSEPLLAEGMADRLGSADATCRWKIDGDARIKDTCPADHAGAMQQMLDTLFAYIEPSSIHAVGHRVVHGGERFHRPTLLDDTTIEAIDSLSHLAPLHNPANLTGIRAAMAALPSIPHIAVFDTAFHHAMPAHASLYAVPYAWYGEHGVRRYGFHGTSHHFVAQIAAKRLGREFTDCRLITAHLGNGCSAAAIRDGVSVDTTMGLTPLEGLVMGTRSGDVDPGLHDFMARRTGMTLAEVNTALNRESGLLGISGLSNDMRTLLAAADEGHEQARLAIDIFCYRLAKSIAALAVPLGRVDALIFTGGIGEHAAAVRARTCEHLSVLGIALDPAQNDDHGRHSGGRIGADASVPVFVLPTNEETMIARYVRDALQEKENHP